MVVIVKNIIEKSKKMLYVCRLKEFNRVLGKINGSILMFI